MENFWKRKLIVDEFCVTTKAEADKVSVVVVFMVFSVTSIQGTTDRGRQNSVQLGGLPTHQLLFA